MLHWSKKRMLSGRIDPKLYDELRRRAEYEGVHIQHLIEHAIVRLLQEIPADREHSPLER